MAEIHDYSPYLDSLKAACRAIFFVVWVALALWASRRYAPLTRSACRALRSRATARPRQLGQRAVTLALCLVCRYWRPSVAVSLSLTATRLSWANCRADASAVGRGTAKLTLEPVQSYLHRTLVLPMPWRATGRVRSTPATALVTA